LPANRTKTYYGPVSSTLLADCEDGRQSPIHKIPECAFV